MPILTEFEYYRPKELSQALQLFAQYAGRAAYLAGGTDLLVWMKEGLRAPEAVVDIKGIPELHRLELSDGKLHVGATVTFTELMESPVVRHKLPLLWECSRTVASVGIRNRATLVGNICSAVPSLDGAPALLAYQALVQVAGPSGQRSVPISDWFVAPKRTAIGDGELVMGLEIPLPDRPSGACYVKLGRYRGEDLAQVGLGILALEGYEYRVAFCAVAPVPARAGKIEHLLNGRELTEELICEAQELIPQEILPLTDIRASREYRMHMAGIMLERGLKAAVARRDEDPEAPAYGESVI
jgi:CO/xanthine dehydrogenase FAD-binding subunit